MFSRSGNLSACSCSQLHTNVTNAGTFWRLRRGVIRGGLPTLLKHRRPYLRQLHKSTCCQGWVTPVVRTQLIRAPLQVWQWRKAPISNRAIEHCKLLILCDLSIHTLSAHP